MTNGTLTREELKESRLWAINFLIEELNEYGKIYYQKVGYTKNNRVYTFWLVRNSIVPRCVCINYPLHLVWNIRQQKDTGCLIMDETDLSSLKYHFAHKMGLDESKEYFEEV